MLKNANLFLMPVFIFLTICFISGCSVNTVENREHKNGIYTGEWQFGRPHGYGTYTVRTDDILRIYEGEWRNGQRHGQGTQTRENSDGTVLSYEGGWRKDLRAGQGIQIYDRGSGETVMYEGNFAGDLIH
ncbi:MAG: hypothetical protein FWH24_05895, partial [Oscillospiraceae bacterium]|nr:hypothetical protein [Oscillospiraceae bacterium]